MGTSLKRFTDTVKWGDPWYRSLSPTAKLLFAWLVDNCDNAGVIDPDFMLASFQIGSKVEESHIAELGDRLQKLPNGKFWLVKFIRFQFGELMANNKVHCSIIRLIQYHSLDYPIPSISDSNDLGMGSDTSQEKEKEKDKDRKGKRSLATLEEVKLCCSKAGLPESDAVWFWNKCEANEWTNGGMPIKSWKHTIGSWKAAGYMPSQKITMRNGQQRPDRSMGTTNEGIAKQYHGIGRVKHDQNL